MSNSSYLFMLMEIVCACSWWGGQKCDLIHGAENASCSLEPHYVYVMPCVTIILPTPCGQNTDYQNSSHFAALWPQQQTKDGQITYKVAIVEMLTGRGGILPV